MFGAGKYQMSQSELSHAAKALQFRCTQQLHNDRFHASEFHEAMDRVLYSLHTRVCHPSFTRRSSSLRLATSSNPGILFNSLTRAYNFCRRLAGMSGPMPSSDRYSAICLNSSKAENRPPPDISSRSVERRNATSSALHLRRISDAVMRS